MEAQLKTFFYHNPQIRKCKLQDKTINRYFSHYLPDEIISHFVAQNFPVDKLLHFPFSDKLITKQLMLIYCLHKV